MNYCHLYSGCRPPAKVNLSCPPFPSAHHLHQPQLQGLHSVKKEPLYPAGICNLPYGPGGYLTEPLLSGLCVLFKCFEIKPFYHVKSLVAPVSSSGLKAILFLPLVFDLRFKSARPPWFRGDFGCERNSQCGKRQGKGWRGLPKAQLAQGTASKPFREVGRKET